MFWASMSKDEKDDFYKIISTRNHLASDILLEIHGEQFEITFDDGTKDECFYLCTLTSNLVRGWKSLEVHKQFMYQVIHILPWRDKAGAFMENDHVMLAWSNEYGGNIVPPLEIRPNKLPECPIPEQLHQTILDSLADQTRT